MIATLADRYEVVRQLGRGSFGHTFLAHDREHDRQVAIKVFDPKQASDWKAEQLFEREAAVLRALRHHGVPEIYDYLRADQNGKTVALLVMEYIEGRPVSQIIEEQQLLDQETVMHLMLELLSVLDYLHNRVPPILHRDIKPSNIIVRTDGTPVLVDFGSVRRVFLSEDESGSTIAGTYGYMPYEQYMGQASPSSDLYALGATMLHLITGRAPREFIGTTGAIDVPELPGDQRIAAVIARMLRVSPADRFSSAREARQALVGGAVAAVAPTRVSKVATASAVNAQQVSVRMAERLPQELPRQIKGDVRKLLNMATPSIYSLTDARFKPTDKPGMIDRLTLTFFGLMTMGILPLVFYQYARSRRRRVERFLRNGIETIGEIREIGREKTAFAESIALVSYEFIADGQLHRNADRVVPGVAQRWAPGDPVRVLYIPDEEYDSIIISVR